VIHLRIVAPPDCAAQALDLLRASDSVANVVHLPGAAKKPEGDVVLCDVAREDVSVIVRDLRELEVHRSGSIALEEVDSSISDAADAAERAARGSPADAVVWEEVEERTSEETELSYSFVGFFVLAMLIAMVGIMLDSTILIIGAMVVGPEFGPIAGFCVAVVQARGDLVRRSLTALGGAFVAGVLVTVAATLLLRALGLPPEEFERGERRFTEFIAHPDAFSFIVAWLAGTAGVLSLTSAKSGALVGVLISVTTIPAAANMSVALAYADWDELRGAAAQLGVNFAGIALAGVGTLYVQRRLYLRRRREHLLDPAREAAGLPVGRSRAGSTIVDARHMREHAAAQAAARERADDGG
jgi:uncharacterized hydrophobic protein (TIGR00271 family)